MRLTIGFIQPALLDEICGVLKRSAGIHRVCVGRQKGEKQGQKKTRQQVRPQ
jgi:hypothetical protein